MWAKEWNIKKSNKINFERGKHAEKKYIKKEINDGRYTLLVIVSQMEES